MKLSRVYRQVVTIEIIWHEDERGTPQHESTDWEGEIRGTVMQTHGNARVGACELTEVEVLDG